MSSAQFSPRWCQAERRVKPAGMVWQTARCHREFGHADRVHMALAVDANDNAYPVTWRDEA